MPAGFTSVNVTPEAAEDLRRFAALAGGALRRRITLTQAMSLASHIAAAHLTTDATSAAAELGIIPTPEGNPS